MFEVHRDQLAKAIGNGLAIVSSANAPSDGRFRQDSNFWYLTGFDEPGATAVFQPSVDDSFALFVRPKDPMRETWDGKRAGPDVAREITGATSAHDAKELEQELYERALQADALWVIGDWSDGPVKRAVERLRQVGRAGAIGNLVVKDLLPALAEMRVIKSLGEIDLIVAACEVTAAGHRAARDAISEGVFEYEVQAAVDASFTSAGGATGFDTIVASGNNACVLHYSTNRDRVVEGDFVLVDAGAQVDHYCGDVTRTYPTGAPSAAQRQVHDLVVAANEACIAVVKPGATLRDIHLTARGVLTEGLIELGVLPRDLQQSLAMEHDKFHFPHGTGHYLGMDVHDVGTVRNLQGRRVLEPGMVITIEPGLYFPREREEIPYPLLEIDDDERWAEILKLGGAAALATEDAKKQEAGKSTLEVPKVLRGIGVRIEDDIVVTADGCRNLTSNIPKSLSDLGY